MNKEVHKVSDAISQTMREVLETTEQSMITEVNKVLVTDSKSFTGSYLKSQSLKKNILKKTLQKNAKNAIALLTEANERASQIAGINPNKINQEIERRTNMLVSSAMKYHGKNVAKIVRLEKIRPLQKAIFQQTQIGIGEGLKIKTKSGYIGYKEYMEMNVRTTMNSEISEQQLKFNEKAKVVFYIANVFADCADDHKDYQGKYYYDDRYKTFDFDKQTIDEIEKAINLHKMLSVQKIRNDKPFFTTRPNCRHKLTPITLDKVLTKKPSKVVNEMQLSTGTYKDKNYRDSQKQRYNERQIRNYKARKEMNEKLYQESGDENYLIQSQKDSVLVNKWQKVQREHIKSNPVLERDYRRETRKVILKDLGAKYNLPKRG